MPAEKPILFVSHSSRDTEAAKAVGRALADLYDVFLDCDVLRAGDDWRGEIERALIECDVGVVLASANSAASDWVPAEAQMLGFRARVTDPTLKLLPVFLDGYDPVALQSGRWQPSGLFRFQGPAFDWRNEATRQAQLAAIVEELTPAARELAERRLDLKEVERYLEGKLEGLNCQPEITEILGFDFSRTRLFLNRARWLASKVLRVHDLERFNQIVLTIKTMDSEELARELVEKLAPYCWVDPEVAGALKANVLSPSRPKASVGLVARKPRTPDACVKRASQRVVKVWKLWPVKPDWPHDDPLGYLVQEVMSHLWSLNVVGRDVVEPDDTVRKRLAMYSRLQGEIVVLLPREFARLDDALLQGLTGAFQHLTFLLATDVEAPELAERFTDFRPLPALDAEAEENADFILGILEPEVGLKTTLQPS